MREALFEQGNVGGKVLIDKGPIRKVHDECRIRRVRGLYQMQGGIVDRRALVTHRSGVVDENAQRYRDILMLEGCDRLGDVVLPDLEIATREVGDEPALIVDN